MLVILLVTKILPSIFQQRAILQQEDLHFEAQLRRLRGGEALLSTRRNQADPDLTLRPMAYLLPDERRDIEAMQLVKHKQISAPDPQRVGFAFTCYSFPVTAQLNQYAMPHPNSCHRR